MDDNGDGDIISLSVGVGRPYVVPELTGTLRPFPPLSLITREKKASGFRSMYMRISKTHCMRLLSSAIRR